MEWLRQISSDYVYSLSRNHIGDDSDNRFASWEIDHEPILESISATSQFLLSNSVFHDNNTVVTIPLSNEVMIHNSSIEDVASHFQQIRVLRSNGRMVELNLRGVKEASRERMLLLRDRSQLNPVVSDLFGANSGIWPQGVLNKTQTFEVIPERMAPLDIPSFDEAWSFITEVFLPCYGIYSISPNNWILSNDFKDSIALRYFVTKCSEVFLHVDEPTQMIIGIDLVGRNVVS